MKKKTCIAYTGSASKHGGLKSASVDHGTIKHYMAFKKCVHSTHMCCPVLCLTVSVELVSRLALAELMCAVYNF